MRGNLVSSDVAASIFWTMNPKNSFINNVASDGWYYGFHYFIPNMNVPLPNGNDETNLRTLPNLEFENNVAYNNRNSGLKIDRKLLSHESFSPLPITISGLKVWNQFINNFDQWGIEVNGDNIIIKNSVIFDSPIGIELKGKDNVIEDTAIRILETPNNHLLISGIIISGQNQTIKESLVEGYVSNEISSPSDFAISNSYLHKEPISGTLIDTKLLDANPLYFGNPVNALSFLQVYGYDAPNGPDNNYPRNFILKNFQHNLLDGSEKIVDMNFIAILETLHDNSIDYKEKTSENLDQNMFDDNEEDIGNFKNKAIAWTRGNLSNEQFLSEVKIQINNGLITPSKMNLDDFDSYQLTIPTWLKDTSKFWVRNLITDQEFFDAVEFVLENQVVDTSFIYN